MTSLLTFVKFIFHSLIKNDFLIYQNKKAYGVSKTSNLENFDIAIYLPTPPSSYYQLSQWLDPLKKLNKQYKIVIVTRNIFTFVEVSNQLSLQVIHIERVAKLREFFRYLSPKVVLYVNNSLKNNQSLLYKNGYHIHLNHGESEKECMSSNQSKAYDYVFTVGQRGIDRYKENLLNFDKEKYLKIGRPQLDFVEPSYVESPGKKIIYAPTWEAHHQTMDYCSAEEYGIELVRKIINQPGYILIYKPHPLIGSKRRHIKKAHNQIKDMIKKADNAFYYTDTSIVNLFSVVDFAFFDNSSVMIDYLFFDKPAAYIEIRKDVNSNNIHQAYSSYGKEQLDNDITSFINKSTLDANKNSSRFQIKEHYLGNYKKNESTNKFITTIDSLIKKRNDKIDQMKSKQ